MKYIWLFILLGVCHFGWTQGLTLEDYERAVSFTYNNYHNKTVFNLHTEVNWFEDESGLSFIDYSPEGKSYKKVHFKDMRVSALFDHVRFSKSLGEMTSDTIDPKEISIQEIERGGKGLLTFVYKEMKYKVNLSNYQIEPIDEEKEEKPNSNENPSPDGKWIAFARDYNVYIRSVDSGEEFALSNDGERGYQYANRYGWYDKMEGEDGDRPTNFFVSWSPDSRWLHTFQWDTRKAEKMYLLDWSKDELFKPRLLSYFRGSPGDTNMVMQRPVVFDVHAREELELELPTNTHINPVYISWSEREGEAYTSYAERGYQKEYLKHINLEKAEVKTLITEESNTNIDNFTYTTLDSIGKVIFLSERSGWRQMYAYDLKTDILKNLTKGDFYIHRINHIDEEEGRIYFLASGREESTNPYHQLQYAVTWDGNVQLLTAENANHSISFSSDGKFLVDNISSVDQPTRTVLRAAKTGEILVELTTAKYEQALEKGWQYPEVFEFTGKDGKTTLYGALWKPTDFDSSKTYPIIDHSYTGPHTQVFPRSFSRAFSNQALAELGFVVMFVDGLGSSGRSKAFHDYSYKNMGNNLEDHVLAIQHLGETRSWIDADRVGIFGHSAGGYDAAHALLAFPDVYKVGVSSSADHDFRMEKAWWPEMYMGWPVDESYHEVSNITMAGNLKGKLLLVHGGLDDNVNPSATFKLAEALVRADKQFDLMIYPSQRHGYSGDFGRYFIKQRWNYFVEHLTDNKPIWDFSWE